MKVLYVHTPVQQAVMQRVLLQEMLAGFWKDGRPKGGNLAWEGVKVEVGRPFGAVGFKVPRLYNYLNPLFLKSAEPRLLEAARSVVPTITKRALHRELIELARIVGGRITEPNGPIIKLNRGQKTPTVRKVAANITTRRVVANIVDQARDAAV